MKRKIGLTFLSLCLLFQSGGGLASGAGTREKISFNIRVTAEGNASRLLTEAVIDGPAGTDFNIALKTEGFEMDSEFLTDRSGDSGMTIRVGLETKRSYGLSPNGLPLFEVDSQKHTIDAGFEDSVVLLPFGRNADGDTLRIEISPRSELSADADADKLGIRFLKDLTNGEIAINAWKVPHHFELDAKLLLDGSVAASAEHDLLLKRPEKLLIGAGNELQLEVEIEEFIRSRPSDLVRISYGLKTPDGSIVSAGKGINALDGEFRYGINEGPWKGYELIFRIKEKKQQ